MQFAAVYMDHPHADMRALFCPCTDGMVCSIKDWDCCSLSLQPCTDPVCTPKGVLYEREAIYEYILKEKTRIAQEMKAWESEQAKRPAEERIKRKLEEEERVRKFEESECGILPPTKAQKTQDGRPAGGMLTYTPDFDTLGQKKLKDGVMRAKGNALGHKSLLEGARLSEVRLLLPAYFPLPPSLFLFVSFSRPFLFLPSFLFSSFLRTDYARNVRKSYTMTQVAKDSCFWLPDTAPDAYVKDAQRPDEKVRCPISNEPLRLKDLTAVQFTKLDESKDVTKNNSNHNERYMCPVIVACLSICLSVCLSKCLCIYMYVRYILYR